MSNFQNNCLPIIFSTTAKARQRELTRKDHKKVHAMGSSGLLLPPSPGSLSRQPSMEVGSSEQ